MSRKRSFKTVKLIDPEGMEADVAVHAADRLINDCGYSKPTKKSKKIEAPENTDEG